MRYPDAMVFRKPAITCVGNSGDTGSFRIRDVETVNLKRDDKIAPSGNRIHIPSSVERDSETRAVDADYRRIPKGEGRAFTALDQNGPKGNHMTVNKMKHLEEMRITHRDDCGNQHLEPIREKPRKVFKG